MTSSVSYIIEYSILSSREYFFMENPFETKIKAWAKEDASVAQALEIACRAHQGQFDKAGVLYIMHPMAVAVALGAGEPRDTFAVVVALLHDVLKNTEVTEQELVSTFPPLITDAILALTRQAGEDYESFIRRLAPNRLARKVKIADLRHNLDHARLKKLTDAEQERLKKKYTSALNYLITFVDKDELAKQLLEESRFLPPGTLPHDAMNKAAFVHAEMLEGLLRFYVDEPFVKDLDLKHAEPLPNEFVTETMRKRYSDCIRKVRWKDRDAYLLVILEFQSTKDIWIPVRILAYTALLWLDLINNKLVTREEGLPPVFPVVLHSGSEKWNDPLSIHELLSPVAKTLLKYQPNNLALLVDEKTITDEVLNKNSDFYALYLELKRAKTLMAMREASAVNKDGHYIDLKMGRDIDDVPESYWLVKAAVAAPLMTPKELIKNKPAGRPAFCIKTVLNVHNSRGLHWKSYF